MKQALRDSLAAPGQSASAPKSGKLPFSVGIMAFGTRLEPLLGLTDDAARIDAAIARLAVDRERDGKTRLHDAVAGGLAQLRGIDAASKTLIVISDGDDDGSDISQSELIRRATDTGIPINAIGFGKLAASRAGSLATMAGATGGTFQVANTDTELRSTFGRMIRTSLGTSVAQATAPASAPAVPSSSPAPTSPPASSVAPSVATASQPVKPLVDKDGFRNFFSELPAIAWAGVGLLVLALIIVLVLLRRRGSAVPEVAPIAVERVWNDTHAPSDPTVVNKANDKKPDAAYKPAHRPTMVVTPWPLPDSGNLVAVLQVTSQGPDSGRRFDMRGSRLRIGSGKDNEVVLDSDDFVSAQHALLRAEAGNLYLVDLGALNGTEINGTRFKGGTRAVSPGDRITVGRTTLEVTDANNGR